MKNREKKLLVLSVGIIFAVLVVDQALKFCVKTSFSLFEKLEVAPWFYLCFTENDGMAFGMDFIGTMFLCLFRVAAVAVFLYLLVRVIRRGFPTGLIVCLSLIIAGAAGNIIDNCFYGLIFTESTPYTFPAKLVDFGAGYGSFLSGKVVDMFYFPLFSFDFPGWMPLVGGKHFLFFNAIFNFADAAISCGAIALLIFYRKFFTSENL